jgi:F-type H+-transporting ATPase subunit b
MLIDWFTVVAQIVNFLVLVLLMKYFLYGRLIRTIDERQKRIVARFAEAEEKQKNADRQLEQVHAQLLEQEQQREQLQAQAREEVDRQQREMLAEARASVTALETKWDENLVHERSVFLADFRQRAAVVILTIIRRALSELASYDLRQAAFQVFLEKLRSLDITALRTLTVGEVKVLTAEGLPEELKHKIQETLAERLGTPVTVQFEQTKTMSWGIEMRGSGQRLGWSSESYLDSLEQRLETDLDHPEMAQRTVIG